MQRWSQFTISGGLLWAANGDRLNRTSLDLMKGGSRSRGVRSNCSHGLPGEAWPHGMIRKRLVNSPSSLIMFSSLGIKL
jgi:hypothetical protein